MSSLLSVNLERIKKNILELREFGYSPKTKGVYRPGLSSVDMEAREWLKQEFRVQGLKVDSDAVANVIGQWGNSKIPPIVVGSHLDSVPNGGMFDGTLGVLAGLECVRTMQEQNITLKHPIEIIATSEEEGRFGGMLGSQVLTGNVTLDWIETATSVEGESLKKTLESLGFDPIDAIVPRYTKDSIAAFLELHVEQGPVLDNKKIPIGIVSEISGVFKWFVKLIGKADHAGTAPMDMRSDAFMGLADFAHELHRIIDEEGSDKTRLTIGTVELKPGFAHTIPGEVDFTIVGRDSDELTMQNIAGSCRKVLSSIARKHRLMFEFEEKSWLPPQPTSENIISEIEHTVKDMGIPYLIMPSGAGHDTQFFAKTCPSGLIFVPSVHGISHAPDEWTNWSDVEKGANVLLNTILRLDKQL